LGKFAEATRHNMTASRLAAAGTMALGAATYFYFADPARREAAIQAGTRIFESMTSWWQGAFAKQANADEVTEPAPNPGAPGIA
jgi:hypothetical protein